ncbi:universal stress protein [Streptomyces fuscichromogenes]|uniref:universal stress protein n=1 Tax=Streptomyces fuscichromogenes TaxID=1324013 RepID=UPI00381AD752
MTRTGGRHPVVVGLDPVPDGRAALTWAADEAVRRRVPLVVLYALGTPAFARGTAGPPVPLWADWADDVQTGAERLLKEAVAFAGSRHPRLEVSGVIAEGGPAFALGERSVEAALVVVGSWHLSAVHEAFTSGGVAVPLAARASCPVVMVPERRTPPAARFVVGVDGSIDSAAAVDLAFEEASLHGADLRALYVWHPPVLGALDEGSAVAECRRVLGETVAGRTAAHPEVGFEHEVVRGHPVQVLTDASEHGLGLVVGTRGHGGLTGLLLGSVGQGVLRHARCPVITVPRQCP